jgi:hypothetical protein
LQAESSWYTSYSWHHYVVESYFSVFISLYLSLSWKICNEKRQ